MMMHPFKISVDQGLLDDLRSRLIRTRWSDEIPDSGWDYGANLTYMKKLVDYWVHTYDWRKNEQYMNSFNHYIALVDETKIHFIHEHGSGKDPLPLIITHGWPSSFYQMLKLIPLLTHPEKFGGNPEDSFDVVVPSLPGYGFSNIITNRGRIQVADYWKKLMVDGLGYQHFVAAGGDIGSGITARLGKDYPQHTLAIHLTDAWADINLETPSLSEAEHNYLIQAKEWEQDEGAYQQIQATKPQTLAYGLNDSPVGLAAWIIEKFYSWSDCQGNIENKFTKDDLITNVMIYWITQTINSSMRYYYEYYHEKKPRKEWKIDVPTGIALFPKDIDQFPEEYAQRSYNVKRFSRMKSGGHFAALEETERLASDIREFFRNYRNK